MRCSVSNPIGAVVMNVPGEPITFHVDKFRAKHSDSMRGVGVITVTARAAVTTEQLKSFLEVMRHIRTDMVFYDD